MCGLAGELRFDGQAPDRAALARMLAPLARRGPDSEGSYVEGPLAMGHRRLAIIDLSTRANQPMTDNDTGCTLVFNGTIYNYRALRAQLQGLGQRFVTTGDTEVILKAYAVWGERCVERFTGMFAFGLWDSRRQQLLLARDRLGIKPLYYTRDNARLRFASNTQALLAAGGVDTTLDPIALHHHFTLHAVVPAPRTILRGLHKLPPATTLRITPQGATTQRLYWQLDSRRPATSLTDEEWIAQTHDHLRAAVKSHLDAADVPVGVLLSGGLDSSLLVALLAEAGAGDIRTFSVGFEDQPEESGNEFEFSDPVAARYGTQHHKFVVPNSELLPRIGAAVDAMAEPMVGQDATAFYLLAERVAHEVKVVQSGQGADEVFGGYFWYPRMAAETHGTAVERFARHYFDRDHAEFYEMFTPAYHSPDYTRAWIARALDLPQADSFMDQVLRCDVTTLIVDDPVKRVDNMTMAWGLEARVPFLDHHVVEHAARMPPELRLRNGGKYPLKTIARGRLPDAVIDRPKGYFPLPALKYVRGAFWEFMRDILNSDACVRRGLYHRAYVARLLAQPEAHMTRLQGSKLWHLALLELWLQKHVDSHT